MINTILVTLGTIATTAFIIRYTMLEVRWQSAKKVSKKVRRHVGSQLDELEQMVDKIIQKPKTKTTIKSEVRKGQMSYDRQANVVYLSGDETDYVPQFLNHLLEYHEIPQTAQRIFTGE